MKRSLRYGLLRPFVQMMRAVLPAGVLSSGYPGPTAVAQKSASELAWSPGKGSPPCQTVASRRSSEVQDESPVRKPPDADREGGTDASVLKRRFPPYRGHATSPVTLMGCPFSLPAVMKALVAVD
jgi:hypothetical protein